MAWRRRRRSWVVSRDESCEVTEGVVPHVWMSTHAVAHRMPSGDRVGQERSRTAGEHVDQPQMSRSAAAPVRRSSASRSVDEHISGDTAMITIRRDGGVVAEPAAPGGTLGRRNMKRESYGTVDHHDARGRDSGDLQPGPPRSGHGRAVALAAPRPDGGWVVLELAATLSGPVQTATRGIRSRPLGAIWLRWAHRVIVWRRSSGARSPDGRQGGGESQSWLPQGTTRPPRAGSELGRSPE